MVWNAWQLYILAVINIGAGMLFGLLISKMFYKNKETGNDNKCRHKSDGELYTRGNIDGTFMIKISNCPEHFKNNQSKCVKCGEYYK